MLIFCFLSSLVVQQAQADAIDILKLLGNLYGVNIDQLTALKDLKTINGALKELSEKEVLAVTGHYRMGDLYNSHSDQVNRLWANEHWQDVLKQASGGNSGRFRELLKVYHDRYPTVSQEMISPLQSNSLKAKTYIDNAKTNLAGLSVSEYSYNALQDRVKRLQGLLNQIESTPNQKAAQDLQTRVLAEIGFLQVELLRVQSVQAQLSAMQGQGMTNGTTQDAQFVKWTN